jgi:hypothetical protein
VCTSSSSSTAAATAAAAAAGIYWAMLYEYSDSFLFLLYPSSYYRFKRSLPPIYCSPLFTTRIPGQIIIFLKKKNIFTFSPSWSREKRGRGVARKKGEKTS